MALFLGVFTAGQAQTLTQKGYAAVANNQPAVVESLLTSGADVNASVEMMPGVPTTFLILAAGNGHLDLAKILVKHKAQVDKADSFNATALLAAATNGSLDVVQFLLAHGANAKPRTRMAKMPWLAPKKSATPKL